jgi:FtsP/CotA-like multicopper oxidase with cupredoxin domain
VGDRILVHFKNLDTVTGRPHSMHFHGVSYRPSSDGAHLPGFSGGDGEVRPGQTWTYRLRAGRDAAGVWPYHDHSPSMDASIAGGMYGMLSILGRKERVPDREFVVVFSAGGPVPGDRSPRLRRQHPRSSGARSASSSSGTSWRWAPSTTPSTSTGHRWREPDGRGRDTQTVGPAESFRVRWRERDPGTWLYHCHVESHMGAGMIGIYQVRR